LSKEFQAKSGNSYIRYKCCAAHRGPARGIIFPFSGIDF
jgi:hypothetical protein